MSYTNNWPYEPLVGNTPPPSTFLWSMFSIVFMIAGIGLLGWHYAGWQRKETASDAAGNRPAAQHRRHAIDARDGEIFLGRARADC